MEASRPLLLRTESGPLGLVLLLLAASVVAWLVTEGRMAGMDHGPGSDLGSLGFYLGTWVVMMAAMMLPSIAPVVHTYGLARARRQQDVGLVLAAVLFVVGYLAAWTAFGLAAYVLVTGVERIDVQALAWDEGGRWLVVGVIVAGAVYQLTAAKDACLTHCRSPRDLVMDRWREGFGGAVRLGAEHGAWCVGCCWAFMACLFALGAMSLAWMAFVAGLIAIEKLLPWKPVANRGIAALLLFLALVIAVAPESLPGFTVPH